MTTTGEAKTGTAVTVYEFDHSTTRVDDLVLAERFYSEILGELVGSGYVEDRSGLTTDELLRFKRLITVMEERERRAGNASRGPRVPAPHSTVVVGAAVVPMFLLTEHVQEPPPEQLRGTPRMAFGVTPEQMDRAVDVLRGHKIPFEGPVEHAPPCPAARSLYFKDPSGNFLELTCPRNPMG
jgi:catechol-2,3-dioxygenase